MREIKFRAWDEQKKVMHFDFQFIKSGDSGNDWIIFQSDKENFNGNFNPYFSQQLKIMQYTGLKDKNGVEIYEGDVIKNEVYIEGNKQVEFHNGSFGYKILVDDSFVWYAFCENTYILSDIEVIGNIYEHKHLLGSE